MSYSMQRTQVVHEILKRYLKVDKAIFGSKFLNMFRAIKFDEHTQGLDVLIAELENVTTEIGQDDPRDRALHQYSEGLAAAIRDLRNISANLGGKAQGDEYPFDDYQKDVAYYRSCVEIYQALGQVLNNVMSV